MERFDKLTPPPAGPRADPRRRSRPEGHACASSPSTPTRGTRSARPRSYAKKNKILDDWCVKLDRNPRHVERTVGINASEIDDWQAYLDAGAEHLIVMAGPPFDLDPVRRLLETARG